jgi:hypothetical protein
MLGLLENGLVVQEDGNAGGPSNQKLMGRQAKLVQGSQYCQSRTKSATELLFNLKSAQLWFSEHISYFNASNWTGK